MDAIAVILAQATDLGSESKLHDFRTNLHGFLETVESQALEGMAQDGGEPWWQKDAFYLFCELYVFGDVTEMQHEVIHDFKNITCSLEAGACCLTSGRNRFRP